MKINLSILLAHTKTLKRCNAKYLIIHVDKKISTITSGVSTHICDNKILKRILKRIITGFVNNKAYNGDLTLNPFNFQHFNLNYLTLFIDVVNENTFEIPATGF